MKNKRASLNIRTSLPYLLPLALGGFAAGFSNGLLGAGGGVILVIFLSHLIGKGREDGKSIYANAICVMLPLSMLTLSRYPGVLGGKLTLPSMFILGAIAGGILGGLILGKLHSRISARLFACLTVLSGILMIVR